MVRRILLATDGSPRSLAAARQAGLPARGPGATITVAHVITGEVPVGSVAPTPHGAAEEVLLRTCRHLGHGAMVEEERLLEGDPASEILRFATDGGYDLIVLGSRRMTRWQRLLLGSVSRVVVEHGPCSVMVARPTKGADGHLLYKEGDEAERRCSGCREQANHVGRQEDRHRVVAAGLEFEQRLQPLPQGHVA